MEPPEKLLSSAVSAVKRTTTVLCVSDEVVTKPMLPLLRPRRLDAAFGRERIERRDASVSECRIESSAGGIQVQLPDGGQQPKASPAAMTLPLRNRQGVDDARLRHCRARQVGVMFQVTKTSFTVERRRIRLEPATIMLWSGITSMRRTKSCSAAGRPDAVAGSRIRMPLPPLRTDRPSPVEVYRMT